GQSILEIETPRFPTTSSSIAERDEKPKQPQQPVQVQQQAQSQQAQTQQTRRDSNVTNSLNTELTKENQDEEHDVNDCSNSKSNIAESDRSQEGFEKVDQLAERGISGKNDATVVGRGGDTNSEVDELSFAFTRLDLDVELDVD
ncbi:hypothetical protein HDU76_006347, partial [Blyttiomyces sp. JEL0837]